MQLKKAATCGFDSVNVVNVRRFPTQVSPLTNRVIMDEGLFRNTDPDIDLSGISGRDACLLEQPQ